MSTVLAHFKVKDFPAWRNGFANNEPMRSAAGITNVRVLHSVDDPGDVFIQGDTGNVAKAKEFAKSPELKAVMEKTGVVSSAEWYFLDKE